MGVLAAYAVPHPPLIVPSVGNGEERAIQDTVDAYREIARRTLAHRPDTIVVASPHAPLYRDAFHLTDQEALGGTMAPFGAPQTRVSAEVDRALVRAIAAHGGQSGLPLAGSTRRDREMDHATFIPLYFVNEAFREAGEEPAYRLVRVGLSGLPFEAHRELGRAIAEAVCQTGRDIVFMASGDLSHKLKADGPYGFAPEGPEFDARIAQAFASGDLESLFGFDEAFCDAAAECGLRSFQIMAGVLASGSFDAELLSCEGPFGVGYAVAAFEPKAGETGEDDFSGNARHDEEAVDPYVSLARASVEHYVRAGKPLHRPESLPEELLVKRAGVFVSLHERGELRGCIGTIEPSAPCVADEIIRNGIAACSEDPRFPPVRNDELDWLEYSVDVLLPAERIASADELDPSRYGVIVTKGRRRGLLLPNLEGVDTAADQVSIAKRKAGIDVLDDEVELERFEVVRHSAGGEARHGGR